MDGEDGGAVGRPQTGSHLGNNSAREATQNLNLA